jgi:hypothetical protein
MWSQQFIWYMGMLLLGVIILALLVPLNWSPYSPADVGTYLMVTVAIVVTFIYVLLVFSLGESASLDPLKEVSVLAVRIMTALPQPYGRKVTGLAYQDIKHLRQIAEIEQNSADWRGAFVSFVIIGTLSVVLWLLPSIWRATNEVAQPATPATPPTASPLSSILNSSFVQAYLTLAAVGFMVLAFRLIWNMLNYFRLFLAGEAANRVILKACEEALAFLEKRDLTERESFSLREKRAIAAHFGCKIIIAREAAWADKIWTRGFEPDGILCRQPGIRSFRI